MKNFILILVMLITGLTMNSLKAQTPTAPSGSGTIADPYQISTLNNLFWLSQNSSEWNKYYVQTTDIDAASTSTGDSGAGWMPLDTFSGYYDGNGHTISNLFINRPSSSSVGFFGLIFGGAVINNLGLINVNITGGNEMIGSLAGIIHSSSVNNCYSTGTVSGKSRTGGLIGQSENQSIVTNCYSNCTVSIFGTDSFAIVGGLIGLNKSSSVITKSYATGNITGGNDREIAGGLVGRNEGSTINQSYATGNVSGGGTVGSLVGDNYISSIINNCYARGNANGTQNNVGGLVGSNRSSIVNKSFSTGTAYSSAGIYSYGGILGSNEQTASINDSFWDTQTSGLTTGCGYNGSLKFYAIGKTTTEMKNQNTFTSKGWDFIGETTNGVEDIWKINSSINNGYPFFSWQDNTPNAYPSIGIVGDATSGWQTDIAMNTTDGITYTITAYTFKNGGAKFRQDNAWAINWGSNAFPSGIGTQDGPNIPVIAGIYNVTFNRNTGAYNFTDPANTDWKLQTNPVSTNAEVGKIQFVRANEGWISISPGGLLHTTDGGTTWTEVPLDLPEVLLSSLIDPAINMCFISPSTGWVLKTFGTFENPLGAVVYKTTNGGLNWQKIILSQVPKDLGGQIQFIDENNGYASIVNTESGLGKYYKTTDGGTTWSLLPSDGTIGIFYSVDLNNAWGILGTFSQTPPFTILHSDNGMTSFTEQSTDNSPGAFWAIQFTDLNHGWVVGQKGKILKTDNGADWTVVTNTGITADYTCKSVYFINATTGWIGAQLENTNNKISASSNDTKILHTTDGGASWTTQTTPTFNPYSIFFWDVNNGWLTSEDNKIARYTGNLGFKENLLNKYLTIYPNPTSGTFYFSLKDTNSKIRVEIYNLSGQKMYEASNMENQTSNEINFAPQSKGVYLIKINDAENNYTEKIMIK